MAYKANAVVLKLCLSWYGWPCFETEVVPGCFDMSIIEICFRFVTKVLFNCQHIVMLFLKKALEPIRKA